MSGSSSDQEDKKEIPDEKEEVEENSANEKDEKGDALPSNKKENESDGKEDESDESEAGVGLLDRPVEVSGSRERKKVQRLELSFSTSKEKPEIPEGSGEKLGECPRIEYQLQRNNVNDLKILHKILFNRPGSIHEIKKNIRKFNGFPFKKDSTEFEKKKNNMEKLMQSNLKHLCEILDLEKSGTKEDIICRILEFLIEPKPSGKALQKKKASGKGTKRKREVKKEKGSKNVKAKPSSSDELESNDSGDAEENDENNEGEKEDEEEEADDDDASDDEPKKKKTPAKKKDTHAKKKVEKKSTPKQSRKKQSASSDDDSSDDEVLTKKIKSPPSDDDIKALVKKILDTSDLQKITMKTVIKQVFDAFPDFDLSDKKGYIKATVKSVIS